MNHFDYSEVKDLFKNYQEKFSNSFSPQELDLVKEFANKLNDLEQISNDIVDINSQLTNDEKIVPDHNEIELGSFKIKLERADPNIPIQLDNATKAYSRDDNLFSSQETKDKERRLERLTSEFYYVAHRVSHIAEKLPKLSKFKAIPVRIIRNHLIEHPEGKDSGVTHDSFAYSKNEGPYVKGLRVGDKIEHMDRGFKINNEEFLLELKDVLLDVLS